MTLKKILSVFLVCVMLAGVFSMGFAGSAATLSLSEKYAELAQKLKNEYVADLSHYDVVNEPIDNGINGFDNETNTFAYEHRVTASDNSDGDILSAANSFYLVAEELISTVSGKGCYNGEKLVDTVFGELSENYFTAQELEEYSTVKEVLTYFVGNTLSVNSTNWNHRNLFVVKTSVEEYLSSHDVLNENSADSLDGIVPITTAVYQLEYTRTFDSSRTRAYYAFKYPSISTAFSVYNRYRFGLGETGITEIVFPGAQSAELFIAKSEDTETIPELRRINELFAPFFAPTAAGEDGLATPWDAPFTYMSDAELEAVENSEEIIAAADFLTKTYSADTLKAVFGENIGNMIVLATALTPTSSVPVRQVTDTATYTATSQRLSGIADKIDGIFSDEDSKAARSLGLILPVLFPDREQLFEGCYGTDGVLSMQKLFRSALTKLVFSDKMVNAIVEFVYSTLDLVLYDISDLIAKAQYAVASSNAAQRADVLTRLNQITGITCTPDMLADYLSENHHGLYSMNCEILNFAPNNDWQSVNYMAMNWGIDELPLEQRANAFTTVLTHALGGIVQLLIPFMCGDAQYAQALSPDENMYNQWLDKYFLDYSRYFYEGIDAEHGPVLLDFKVYLRSQGIYTKLMLPIFNLLGMNESSSTAVGSLNGYVSSEVYHEKIFSQTDGNYENAVRYIVEPFVYWINNTYCNNPVNTSLELIPNLVYLYTRQGPSQTVLTQVQALCNSPVSNAASHGASTVINGETVKPFEYVQTFNLGDIINSIYLMLDIVPPTAFEEGVQQEVIDAVANVPTTFSTGSLLDILGENDQFTGLNGLLDKTLPLTYTNEYGETAPYKLPRVQMSKLTSVTTLNNGEMVNPNAAGIINPRWNTIEVMNTGAVFLPVLRYVFSALGYKYSNEATVGVGENATALPTVKNSMAVDWNRELAPGITLNSVLENAMLRPDDTICALAELLSSNETGYFYRHDKTPVVKNYTYPLDNIKHHAYAVLDSVYNPTFSYGENVTYSKYWNREYAEETVLSAEELVKNFCTIMGIEAFEQGLAPIAENALKQTLFNDTTLNTLFNTVYSLLYTEAEEMGAAGSLAGLIRIVFGSEYTPSQVASAIDGILGYSSSATAQLRLSSDWQSFIGNGTAQRDWGLAAAEEHGLSAHDAFFRVISGMLVPVAFMARFMLLDEPLEPLGILELNSYAGYRYGVIGLLEALSCPDILTHEEYYEKCIKTSAEDYTADANVFYYLFAPVSSLLNSIYDNTVVTVLSIIPNLALFLSTGTANDALNNIMHPLYVLFDIAKPIVNGYELLEKLVPPVEIGGLSLRLTLPFDIDFNKLVADIIFTLTQTGITIMGEHFIIPDFDLTNICAGKLEYFNSKEDRRTVRLDAASGGDALTAVLRVLLKIFLVEENKEALANIIVTLAGTKEDNTPKLDATDKETITILLTELISLVDTYKLPDIALFVVYFISSKLTGISGTIADALKSRDLTLPELIEMITSSDTQFNPQEILTKVVNFVKGVIPSQDPVPGEVAPGGAVLSLFAKIKDYFVRVYNFFMRLFGFA